MILFLYHNFKFIGAGSRGVNILKIMRKRDRIPMKGRTELKYFISEDQYPRIKADLLQFMHHDKNVGKNNKYTVRSLYLDTPELKFYYEKVEGCESRMKIRLRCYEDENRLLSPWFLEIKCKYGNIVIKTCEIKFHSELLRWQISHLSTINLRKLIEQAGNDNQVRKMSTILRYHLEPNVLILYDREPLVYEERFGFRVTFDSRIRSAFTVNPFKKVGVAGQILRDKVMEVKFFGRSVPFWMSRIIQKYGLQNEAISKYCYGLEVNSPLSGGCRARVSIDEGINSSALCIVT